MKKAGAHKKDQAVIKNMAEDGASVAAISRAVNVEEGVVKKFVDHYTKAAPKKAGGK